MRLENVNVALDGRNVLSNVTWSLQRGDVVVVTGPNGAGKSTFLKLLRGDLWPSGGTRTYAFDGKSTRSPLIARERVALVSPELADWYGKSEWVLSALDVVLSGLTGEKLPPFPRLALHEEAARRTIDRLGISHLAERDVRTLSQGQRRRVLLGRALVSRPEALLLDEFFEGVDAEGRAALREAVEGLGLTVVATTHRAEDVPRTATRFVEVGGEAVRERRGMPSSASSRPLGMRAVPGGAVLLAVENADVYRGETLVLQSVNFEWRAGQHWAIFGPNGAGKSTFARLLAGELYPASGTARRLDLPANASLEERRRHIAFVSAETQTELLRAAQLRERVTGADVIASGLFGTVGWTPVAEPSQAARIEDIAKRLGVAALLEREIEGLSYGQLKRLLLARALVGQARLLLLDEPFESLDATTKTALGVLLRERVAQGVHVALVVHHPSDLPDFVTNALHVDAGRVKFD